MKAVLRFLLVAAYISLSIAQGATINVPAGHSIQVAINTATTGDIIVVAPGTYYETINFLGKAITLRSSDGPVDTIINGSGMNGSVVQCVNGEGSDTILEGFTITGGNANIGGGMLNIGSSPTVISCIFTDNLADDRGGGMYNREGNPTVIASTFDGNSAIEMGGGMFNLRASPTVTECLFTQNSSNKGAGMRNYLNSHPIVTNSTFSYNLAGEEGGGMDNRKNSNAVVTGCIFEGNTAGSGGGGMHNYVGRRVEVTGNPLIMNCLFFGNSAPTGAGIRNNDPDPTIINTTIVFNEGAGISSRNGSTPIIYNSIVWGNSGGSFSGSSSGSSIVSYSDIEGGFPGTGNLDENPLFINHAGNDYHLAAGSNLINAGNNNAPYLDLTNFDLDGNYRIIGVTVDMGAYESDTSCSDNDVDGDGYTTCGGDCNDTDDSINPSAPEICDDIDNNCNGTIDEGFDSGCGSDPLLPKGASCTLNSECASNKCKGKSGNMTCK